MPQYRAVEGELGAVDTPTAITTFGAETAVGPIKVPDGARKISEIWAALGAHVDTAGDNCAVMLRLTGKGMRDGDQDFPLFGAGGGVTNTGTAILPAQVYPVDIDVKPNETINVELVATGDTVLIGTAGIGLRFD